MDGGRLRRWGLAILLFGLAVIGSWALPGAAGRAIGTLLGQAAPRVLRFLEFAFPAGHDSRGEAVA